MKFIIKLIISTVAVIIVAKLLPNVTVDSYYAGLLVAIVLAFLNSVVKPILTVLTIPITVVTLGLFLIILNGLIIIFADKLVDGFEVKGFFTALIFSFILSIVTGILNFIFKVNKED